MMPARIPEPEGMCIADCCRFPMTSADGSSAYEIFVHVPQCPPPPGGFPVLYLLDANADFLVVVETLRRLSRRPGATGVLPAIVVGIGYPDTAAYALERRHYDMTSGPPADDRLLQGQALAFGGQATFRAFLKNRLKPLIDVTYAADPSRGVLFGHSLAGYFVLEAMLAEPGLFAAYGSVSPSIWWDPERFLSAPIAAAAHTPFRLYAAVGGYEEELAPWQQRGLKSDDYSALRRTRRMVGNVRTFCDRVATAFGGRADVRFDLMDGEDHASVFIACLSRALRFTLGEAACGAEKLLRN